MAFFNPDISFGVTGLQGETVNNPTALDFSKTGNPTLFVAQQDGNIWRLEIERQADGADADSLPDFVVTDSTLISDVKTDTQNYNDDGSINTTTNRQMTGLITSTDADGNDVLYVNSSDWRIAVGNDANLGTNSSQIHKITLDPDTGEVLSNVAIVRGLPRSEENHSVNGFDIAIDPVTGHEMLWVAVGGNTNNGAPGNNFAGTVDYPYSGTILKIDLTVLEGYDVQVDGNGDQYILDLPTLDDPTRPNVDLSTLNILNPEDAPNFTLDDNGTGTNGELNPDWAGGNNGLNAAKVVDKILVSIGGQLQFVDNPLQIHSPGYRNPYDVEITEAGEVFTWDNGPNTGWGGQPIPFVDDTPGDAINYVQDWTKELATNLFNESGSQGFGDQLHYAGDTSDEFGPYGGFASPIRAAAAILAATFDADGNYIPGAGNPLLNINGDVIFANETEAQAYLASLLIVYEEQGDGNWVDVSGTTGLPADLYDIVSGYNWIHPGSSLSDPTAYYDGTSVQDGTIYSPESQLFDDSADGSLKTVNASTNGLAEYTASNFDGALNGVIVAASFNGNLYFEKPVDTDGDGRTDAVQSLGTINGFGSTPLTVATLGDNGLGTFIDNDGDGIDDFAGLIVAGTYGADNVTFFVPGGQAVDPSTDLDLDGQDNINDSHVGDPLDGRGVVVGANETLTWQFELSTPTTPPGAIPSGDSIAGDIGINAVWRNGVDSQVTSDGTSALYNPGIWNLGGASTFVSIDVADTGNAVGTANDQADVLGIGFEIQDNLSGLTIMSEMLNVFSYTPNTDASKTWDGGEKFGLMVGPGDQTTFVEATIAVDASSGTPKFGLQLVVEENDVPNTVFVEIPGIDNPVRGIADPNLQIALDVDLTLGAPSISARARYVDDGAFTDWVSTSALSLPDDVREAILGQYNNNGSTTGAVVGLVSSAPAGDDSFAASWDWVEVTGQDAVETAGTVLYRWNAGDSDVAAVDGGLDWVADASVVVGGPTKVYSGNIAILDPSASQYTIPTGIFTQERWDPSNGAEMGLEFGDGTLESGTYAVRLLMGDAFFNQTGSRVFDVSIEDQLFLDDLDLVANFGPDAGGVFEWVGQVTDGTIDIDFQRVIENPLINGVEIVQLNTTPVDPVVSANAGNFSETDGTVSLSITSATAVPSGQTIDVNFELRPITGGATPELDYTSAGLTYDAVTGFYSGSGQIAEGQTTLDIIVDLLPDAEIEGPEAFELHVTSVSGASASIGTAVATITIDDLEDSVNGTNVGDFSDDGLNPTAVNLTQGDTVLVSTQDGDPTRDYDYVTIIVPTGHELTSLTLSDYADYDASITNASFLGLQAGAQFTETPANPDASNLLGGVIYDEFAIGSDLLVNMADGVIENAGGVGTIGFTTPLGAGSYTLWWSQGGSPTTSTITATVDAVDIPGNSAPVISSVSDVVVDELSSATVQVLATDADAGDVITLSVALEDSSGTPVVGYSFTDNGDGTGDFSWSTPDVSPTSAYTATITASDGVNPDVTSSFDITVNDLDAPVGGTVLYRWNGGNSDVAAVDGGPDWVADTSVVVGGPTKVYSGNVGNLDASVDPASVPAGLFTQERWDPSSGAEMGLEFGDGALASGTYAVRLLMGEGFFTQAGSRVFDVSIEDQLFLDDLDLVDSLGPDAGGMFEWVGEVTDGTIDIDFDHVVQNPLINGVEIIQLGTSTSPVSSLSVTPSSGSEDAGTQVTITVTTSVAVTGDQTVDLGLSGSGISASDFTAAIPASITIPDGTDTASITLNIADDADIEGLETATFTLSNPSAGIVLGTTVSDTLDIIDNDAPANQAPSFTSSSDFGVTENTTTVGTVSATDPEDDAIQFAIAGGADAGLFTIDQTSGVLSFLTAPDFETPADTGGDNIYNVTVSAFDGTNTVTQDIAVTVADDPNETSTGAATLSVNAGSNDVQISNFGNNSFVVTNVGSKAISSIEIDVTNALYPDSVFDPFGLAGDTASKPLQINSNGNTGVQTPTNASYIGAGGTDGYSGIVLTFDPLVNGGFESGETLGFSVDMDPNSVAGAGKTLLDSGSSPSWDVGGVSGAELIGSSFTITFADGSTATGQLQSDGSQGGSVGLADQASPNTAVQLNVNGLSEGAIGTYDATGPTVVVSGPAGATARIVLTKGFIQPVTNNFTDPYKSQLDAQLAALALANFPANNAVEFQTVDVLLDGTNQDITNLFDFADIALYDFVGEDQLPLGFVASVIDTSNNDLPLGAVTAPIYLEYSTDTSPVASLSVTPSTGSEDAGTQVTITLTTSVAVTGDQTVDLALSGSGVSATDFTTAIPTSMTILDGTNSASITLNVADDADIENLETATFTISNPSAGVELGTAVSGTLDITDNDAPAGNSAPVITPVSDLVVDEFQFANAQVVATDADAGDVITLSVALEDSSGTPVTGYSFTDNGDGTGDFSWSTPDVSPTGVYTATITASDGVNPDVTSTFDITVNDLDAPVGGTVLYRWNAGNSDVAAVDGGPDWVADTSAVIGGPTKVYSGNVANLDAGVDPAVVPAALFTQERWDPSGGSEMGLEFGDGSLESGTYAVRLYMGDGFFTQAGSRVFDVSIEDQLFLDDIDLVASLGPDAGGVFEWVGQVTDGTVDIDFQHVVQNPLVNGVEIVLLDTGADEFAFI